MKISNKKLKRIIREEVQKVISEQEQYDQATPEHMLDQLLQGIEQYSQDPEVMNALAGEGFSSALAIIRSKIVGGDDPSGDTEEEQGLAGVMEAET
jgi:hypothetical protein